MYFLFYKVRAAVRFYLKLLFDKHFCLRIETAVKRTKFTPSGDTILLFDWLKRILITLDSSRDSFVAKHQGAADYFCTVFSICQ